MNIKDVLRSLNYKSASLGEIEISGVSCDSRRVKKGYMFVAIKGAKANGHKFIDEALEGGAAAVVAQEHIIAPEAVAKIYVEDSRSALAVIANEFYGRPSERLKCVGITGTNGKTTTSYLMDGVLSAAGHRAGIIGTINYRIGRRIIPATNTTPGPIELCNFMNEMLKASLDSAVMEVSSHSLDQRRVEGINFSAAIFTNLTGDHLDYHKTLEDYFDAKAKLFEGLNKNSYGVINTDDEWGRRLLSRTKGRIVTYGADRPADFFAEDIKLSLDATRFRIAAPAGKIDIRTKLIGRHNVYNITSAVAAGVSLGLPIESVVRGVEGLDSVSGRLESIDCGQPYKVFVDYAHTDDALYNVLCALRPLIKNKMIVVFGCGGDRDRTKRPRMGRVAAELADLVIVTSDNPRSEEPCSIADEIVAGIKSGEYTVVLERAEAIRQALSDAREGDCVLIAGKGHEPYQVFKDTTVAFDDREVAKDLLCSISKKF